MALLSLDERTQRALLLAAALLQGGALAGCRSRPEPRPVDPLPEPPVVPDRPEDRRPPPPVPDPPPEPPVVDPLPPDDRFAEPPQGWDGGARRPPHVVDPLPADGGRPRPRPRPPRPGPDVVDMLPVDPPPPPPPAPKGTRGELPLAPDLRTRIVRHAGADGVELTAWTTYRTPALRFVWYASGGELIASGAAAVWRPPAAAGHYLVQVTAIDGDDALAVDAVTEEVG